MAQKLPLSLTAELEKLEQQITLTLQEIDHNFNRAHRIVTTSIIPIVERYAKESEAVWEGSKFWKQFFEASANVALSNYQEEETYDQTQTEATQTTYTQHEESSYPASSPANYSQQSVKLEDSHRDTNDDPEVNEESDDSLLDDSLLESLNLTGAASHSTPKAQRGTQTPKNHPSWANIESPYEALKKELSSNNFSEDMLPPPTTQQLSITDDSIPPPSTPRSIRRPSRRRAPPTANPETPESSPFDEPPTTIRRPGQDQLLHRVLEKNWRLQATPMGKPPPSRYKTGPGATPRGKLLFPPDDSDDDLFGDDSPPKPQTAIFSSPPLGPKTPVGKQRYASKNNAYDEDSDDDLLPPGFSPPVTIQFSLPPSKLLATPAREASRRIVHDILQTAGAADESAATDSSPPIVQARYSLGDDTF